MVSLLHPHVGYHDLPLHVDPDDLRHLDPHLDRQTVRAVAHGTYQPGAKELTDGRSSPVQSSHTIGDYS